MTRPILPVILAAAILEGLALPTAAATAPTVNKTWVSSTGTDTGSCQLVAPCRTFAYAITATSAGGEIDVKDSGSYGSFTIDKGVTVVAEGVLASIGVPSGGTGIVVKAASYESVVLHGLNIDGHRSGSIGIDWQSGKSLGVENCLIRNLSNFAIQIKPSNNANYSISDTTITNVNYLSITSNNSGTYTLAGTIDNLHASFNNAAIAVIGDRLTLTRSTLANNNVGVISGKNSTVIIGRSAFFSNSQYGVLSQTGGALLSFGDNHFFGDAAEDSMTYTAPR